MLNLTSFDSESLRTNDSLWPQVTLRMHDINVANEAEAEGKEERDGDSAFAFDQVAISLSSICKLQSGTTSFLQELQVDPYT